MSREEAMVMWGTLLLVVLLASVLLVLGDAAPRPRGLAAQLWAGVRELDRLGRLRAPIDRPGH